MKNIIDLIISFKRSLKYTLSSVSEDIIIEKILKENGRLDLPGFYVDVGANDPFRSSNTWRLYHKHKWKGINIEPSPNTKEKFDIVRKRDKNLNLASGPKTEKTFYFFGSGEGFNTFCKDTADAAIERFPQLNYNKLKMQVNPLSDILQDNSIDKVDFLNIDVEGFELEVLKSNDWNKYRPFLICLEIQRNNTADSIYAYSDNECLNFLLDKGYQIIGRACQSWFLTDGNKA